LDCKIETRRKREYAYGHERKGKHVPCGGIERFKLSKHGRDFSHAGMIGYIQTGIPAFWHGQINSWVIELARQEHDPAWSAEEQLTILGVEGKGSTFTSTAFRSNSKIHLTHLWVDLTPKS